MEQLSEDCNDDSLEVSLLSTL